LSPILDETLVGTPEPSERVGIRGDFVELGQSEIYFRKGKKMEGEKTHVHDHVHTLCSCVPVS